MKPMQFISNKYADRGSDWHIYAGVSKFLVAEGAGWSTKIGQDLFNRLKWGDHVQRKPKRKKIERTLKRR